MSATPHASSTAARFVSVNEIRTRFSRAMSEMYRKEVPQYGTLIDLVADVNAVALQADPELRQRMFARGVQLDEQRPGSGLGLDIVRTLAHTYGGRIEVLDAPLGGARLRLWLPQALAE